MKKAYLKPSAKKVDYSFDDQIMAASYPIKEWHDPMYTNKCTWGDSSCNWIFNVPKTRSMIDNCGKQGF